MPAQLVASHTPDRCWTENGMTCLDYEFNVEKDLETASLVPAQWRLFTPGGERDNKIHVLYWHLIDGELYDFGERLNAVPHPMNWIRDAVKDALLGTREQYFVRINSNVPFEEIWNDPEFQQVIGQLEKLGLTKAETQQI